MAGSLGMAIGPLAGGLIHDAFADYRWLYVGAWMIGIGAFLISIRASCLWLPPSYIIFTIRRLPWMAINRTISRAVNVLFIFLSRDSFT